MRRSARNRRGLSEVIATLLLLAITAVSSAFMASLMQNSGFGSMSAGATAPVSPTYAIQLTGYDTRDSSGLLQIDTLDNKFDQMLCTVSCSGSADSIPANDGTEFIAIAIKNVGTTPVYVRNIQINGVTHTWDSQTWGQPFDASMDGAMGTYPQSGKFSILPVSGIVQKSDNQLFGGQEARLVIKLSENMVSDIPLLKTIHILIDFGSVRSTELVILSGEAK